VTYRYPQYHELANALYFFRKKDDAWLEKKLGLLASKLLAANQVLAERGATRLSPSTIDTLFAVFQQFTPHREEVPDGQENQAGGPPQHREAGLRAAVPEEQPLRVGVQRQRGSDQHPAGLEDDSEGLREEIRKAISGDTGGD
jgi:hypothetical protein